MHGVLTVRAFVFGEQLVRHCTEDTENGVCSEGQLLFGSAFTNDLLQQLSIFCQKKTATRGLGRCAALLGRSRQVSVQRSSQFAVRSSRFAVRGVAESRNLEVFAKRALRPARSPSSRSLFLSAPILFRPVGSPHGGEGV